MEADLWPGELCTRLRWRTRSIFQRLIVDFFQMKILFNNSLVNFIVFWRTMSTKRATAVGGILECFYLDVATLQKMNVQFWNLKHVKLSKTKGKWPVLLWNRRIMAATDNVLRLGRTHCPASLIVNPRCRRGGKAESSSKFSPHPTQDIATAWFWNQAFKKAD